MTTVNLALVATGKYIRFIQPLIEQADKFFLRDCDVEYHVFSDTINNFIFISSRDRYIRWHHWPHKPWPHGTLYRYHAMLSAESFWTSDYNLYLDVDTEIVAAVGREVLGGMMATLHHGYAKRQPHSFPYENRLNSRCFVSPEADSEYFAGGFQGGAASDWRQACRVMAEWIDVDASNGITPIHNDESAYNAYLAFNAPDVYLPPQYCWHPEAAHRPYSKLDPLNLPRIIAIDKTREFTEAK